MQSFSRLASQKRVVIESQWDDRDRLVERKSYTLTPSAILSWKLPEELGEAKEKRLSPVRKFHWDRVDRLLQVENRPWGRPKYEYDICDRLQCATRGRSAEYLATEHYSLRPVAILRHFDGAECLPTTYVDAAEGLPHAEPAVRRVNPRPDAEGPGLAVPNAPEATPLVFCTGRELPR